MLRSAYNFDAESFSLSNSLDTGEDTPTQQSFKDECDINTILAKFSVTGQLPDNVRVPTYIDFQETFDFQSSMNVIRQAQESFDAMPSNVRDRFNNDPAAFLEFANDANNYDEALKLGLAVKRPIPDPVPDPPAAVHSVPEGS